MYLKTMKYRCIYIFFSLTESPSLNIKLMGEFHYLIEFKNIPDRESARVRLHSCH